MKTSEKKESGGIRRAEGNREYLVREKYVVVEFCENSRNIL